MKKRIVAWWIYETGPIDEGWESLHPVKLEEVPLEVREAARGLGWEGDVRGDSIGRFMIPVADGLGFMSGYAWKQDNNGTTYIASPVELPHLEMT